MKHYAKFLTALALLVSVPAAAQFTTITRAHEVALSDFHMPASPNGSVSFRPCRDCDMLILSVTVATEYVLNGERLELREFRKRLSTVRDRDAVTLTVMHHLETDTVPAVKVRLAAPAGTPIN